MKKCLGEFRNLVDLTSYFSSEKVCREYLERMRWSDGIKKCPHCNSTKKIYEMKYKYKCSECRRQFSLTKGTIFEQSRVSLRKWFIAIYLLSSNKKGVSTYRLAEDIGVTQMTAWFMTQRIRELFKNESVEQFESAVEIDETYVGGKSSHQGRSTKTKTAVFGILNRETKTVVAQVVENAKRSTLAPIIEEHVKEGTEVFTDEFKTYSRLNELYQHSAVNHSTGEFVIGKAHTNTIENFWGTFKRGVYGIYHHLSRKHMNRYINEFAFRYNNKSSSATDKFNLLLTSVNRRLTYNQLVK